MSDTICPTCGSNGRLIKQITLESLAQDEVLDRLQTRVGFSYCPEATCTVAWFQQETREIVAKDELKVRIGMKETAEPRPICYCFGHNAVEFEAEIQARGQSEIPSSIAAKCKQGLDRCEETNPQGSCCLGNVNSVIKEARRKLEQSNPKTQPFVMVDDLNCCNTEVENETDE